MSTQRLPTGRARQRRSSTEDLALGAVLGGLAGLLVGAAAEMARREQPQRSAGVKLVIGGVDLGGVNLSLPFMVDFSVASDARAKEKEQALTHLRRAMTAFETRFPTWVQEPDVNASAGRFVLFVIPSSQERFVAKNLVGP